MLPLEILRDKEDILKGVGYGKILRGWNLGGGRLCCPSLDFFLLSRGREH